jgi:tetratricopeptide (TPR) repeat protein
MAQAAQAYDRARQIGLPWRMLWYQFGPFTAYYAVGRYQEMVALADATLSTADNIEELYYWKGMALKAEGDLAGARQAWQRAVQLNKNYRAPADALAALGK